MNGTREVASTVVSMSISLGGRIYSYLDDGWAVGRLLREFAVTMSVAVMISLVISLTTTPMMCAMLLSKAPAEKNGKPKPPNRLMQWLENSFETILNAYKRSLNAVLQHSYITLFILLAVICLNVYLYVVIPKGFFPQQDSGRITGNIVADQATSYQAMQQKAQPVH